MPSGGKYSEFKFLGPDNLHSLSCADTQQWLNILLVIMSLCQVGMWLPNKASVINNLSVKIMRGELALTVSVQWRDEMINYVREVGIAGGARVDMTSGRNDGRHGGSGS